MIPDDYGEIVFEMFLRLLLEIVDADFVAQINSLYKFQPSSSLLSLRNQGLQAFSIFSSFTLS